jgi:hypothetical protein
MIGHSGDMNGREFRGSTVMMDDCLGDEVHKAPPINTMSESASE